MIDDRQHELASLPALGALSPGELAALVEYQESAADLLDDLPEHPLPPALERKILASVKSDQIPTAAPQASSWLPWMIAAGFAILAGVLSVQMVRRGALLEELSTVQARVATLGEEIARPRGFPR